MPFIVTSKKGWVSPSGQVLPEGEVVRVGNAATRAGVRFGRLREVSDEEAAKIEKQVREAEELAADAKRSALADSEKAAADANKKTDSKK